MAEDRNERPATFREVFAVGEFRALWAAYALSVAGDQLARVALALLVFDRTSSAALTALTYALTFAPALVGGPLLSGLADRYPRRELMVVCDLGRAILVGVMAVPGVPLGVLGVLLVAVQLAGAPFNAARAAILPDLLTGDRYVVALGANSVTGQLMQVTGFAGGGLLVALIGTHAALGVDAATFVASAALIWLGLQHRRAGGRSAAVAEPSLTRSAVAGVRLLAGDTRLRRLAGLAWIYGLYVVPEGLAAPYGAELGAGPAGVGALMAADPVGAVIGALVLTGLVRPNLRARLIRPLAVCAGLPLIATAAHPGLVISILLWTTTGALAAYLIPANAAFVRATPDGRRGQLVGLAASGLLAAQGLGIVLAGVAAAAVGPGFAIALAGAAGVGLALVIGTPWRRLDSRRSRPAIGSATGTPPAALTNPGYSQQAPPLIRGPPLCAAPRTGNPGQGGCRS